MDGPSVPELLPKLSHIIYMKIYYIAAFTLLVYDYCLTFSAEIEFAWKTRKTFAPVLFLMNRYFSLVLSTVILISYFSPAVTPRVCGQSVLVGLVFTMSIFAVAEAFLTLRIYVFTDKNRYIITVLALHILSRLSLGFVIISQHRVTIALPLQMFTNLINPHAFQICTLVPDARSALLFFRLLMAYLSLFLSFNIIVFIITLFMTVAAPRTGPAQHWLQVMRRDGLMYLVIFLTTLVWLMCAINLPDYLGMINVIPSHIFTAVMINRIYLSLKEDAENISFGQNHHITISEIEQTSDTVELQTIISRHNIAFPQIKESSARSGGRLDIN